jgi:uncharacterized protein (TIGR03437 family)
LILSAASRLLPLSILLSLAALPSPAQPTVVVFHKVVDESMRRPDGPGLFFWQNGVTPSIDGNTIVFRTFDNVNSNTWDTIWIANADGSGLKILANSKTALPNGTHIANFNLGVGNATDQVGAPLTRGGFTVFAANDSSAAAFPGGLYTVSNADGVAHIIADHTTVGPNGEIFTRFGLGAGSGSAYTGWALRDGRVAFMAPVTYPAPQSSTVGIYTAMASGGSLADRADGNHPLHPEFLFGGVNQMRGAATGNNTVVFAGGTIFDPVSGFSAIYAGNPSCLGDGSPLPAGCLELVNAAGKLPGDTITPSHTRFNAAGIQTDGSVVAFYADEPGSPTFAGIYTVPVAGGAIQKIVDTGTTLPGLGTFNKDTIGGFSLDAGNILFRIKDTSGKVGIYLWSAGTITRVVSTGDLVFGHAVADINDPGSSSLSGNTAALTLLFSDGTKAGIYTVSLCTNTATLCAGQAAGTISSFAGNGFPGFAGDGGPAPLAALFQPVSVAADYAGNIYVADQLNHRIRKVDSRGVITTVAGKGTSGFSGDGGPAIAAQLNTPTGIAVDPSGNLYIGDVGNQRIRKVDLNGNITTFAGTGTAGFSGDGGPATQAAFNNGSRTAADAAGNLYVADQSNHRVRKIDATGKVTTFAGTGVAGFSGDGGTAVSALLNNPTALAVDVGGSVYISDQLNHRIRKVDASGTITTLAGNGTAAFSGDGGPATAAALSYPGGLAVDSSGNVFVFDGGNLRVREIMASAGAIQTVAGTGVADFAGDGGPASDAPFNGAFGMALDTAGNLYVADARNNRVRQITGRPAAPTFFSAGVNSAASYAPGMTPGSLAVLFGSRLSTVQGIQVSSAARWPPQLSGTSVTVGGIAAPVYAVANVNGTEQINFQVPFEVAGRAFAPVAVSNNGNSTQAVQVPILSALPGVFLLDGVNGVIVHGLTGAIVGPSSPAAKGEVVVIYSTGLGPLDSSPGTGNPASSTVLSRTVSPVTVTIGGANANVAFSGLTPSLIGVYQINATVPAGAPSGSDDLVVTTIGAVSRTVKISVQ